MGYPNAIDMSYRESQDLIASLRVELAEAFLAQREAERIQGELADERREESSRRVALQAKLAQVRNLAVTATDATAAGDLARLRLITAYLDGVVHFPDVEVTTPTPQVIEDFWRDEPLAQTSSALWWREPDLGIKAAVQRAVDKQADDILAECSGWPLASVLARIADDAQRRARIDARRVRCHDDAHDPDRRHRRAEGRLMVTRAEYAREILHEAGLPENLNNHVALVAWMQAEGSKARYNPLATTRPEPGATDFNTSHVKNYVSLAQGVKATVDTLHNGKYEAILHQLRTVQPATATLTAVVHSQWGTKVADPLRFVTDVRAAWSALAYREI